MEKIQNKFLRLPFVKLAGVCLFILLSLFLLDQIIIGKAAATQGDFEWAKSAGAANLDKGNDITVDDVGNIYVTGEIFGSVTFGSTTLTSAGGWDIFVAKYDNNGNVIWARNAGGLGHDYGKGIAVDASGNIYVTGNFIVTAAFGSVTLTSSGNHDSFIVKYDNSGNVLWAEKGGGTAYDESNGVVVDSSGNVYTTGSFSGSAIFGSTAITSAGAADIFVVKYDNSGNAVWSKSTGGIGEETGKSLAVDNTGNIYTTGSFSSSAAFGATILNSSGSTDIFVTKYDNSGNVLWAKNAGGSGADMGWDMSLPPNSDNVCITGYFEDTATFGLTTLTSSGNTDIFTAKYDNSGNVLWAQGAGSTDQDIGQGLIADGLGNIYITGFFKGTAAFDTISLTSSGNDDIFITKYDSSGNIQWAESAGGTSNEYGNSITTNNFGNLYLTGNFQGTSNFGPITLISSGNYDMYVAKYNIPTECVVLCNPSFEDGLYFWDTNGTPDNQISTDTVDGVYSLYSQHTRSGAQNPVWSGVSQQISSVEPAQTYGISMWAKSLNSARGHLKIKWYNIGGGVSQVDYPIININGTISSWTQFSNLVTSPADAVSAELVIWHGIDASSQNIPGSALWIDDIEFDVATSACGTLCNENFEHGLLYWMVSGSVGSHNIETTGQYEGLKTASSEQMYTTGDPAKWAGVTQFAQVKEGTAYRLRIWLKTENASNGHVRIRWRDTGGNLLNTQYPITGIIGTNTAWFKRQANITAPANAAKAEITIWHGVNGGLNVPGSTIWMDEITLICQELCNAGFEDGNVHWETNGKNEGEIITTNVQEGTQAIAVAQNLGAGDNTQWAGISQRLMVSGGTSYHLRFWLKKENAVQGHVKIKWRDTNDLIISQQYPITGISGTDMTWSQLSTDIPAPANAETMEIFFWHGVDGGNGNATGSTLWLDNIKLIIANIPAITILEPEGIEDNADQHFSILWEDEDTDDDASISFYYDTDTTGEDGTLIVDSISEDDETDYYLWNTASVLAGNYYIYAIISDGENSVASYNTNPVTVMHLDGYSQISNTAGPSQIVITTTDRLAGAIDSLTWYGKEFVNSDDHGRQIQSASQYNNLGECLNPTEAGSMYDGAGPVSSSILKSLSASGNTLTTDIQMAYWLRPGQTSVACPALGSGLQPAQNKIVTSETRLIKNVRIGFEGMPHVIEHLVDYILPSNETYSRAVFEAVTGYMPTEFSEFYSYDPSTSTLTDISGTSDGEQSLPVILSTPNDLHAMGVFSPDLPGPGGTGYGKFSFPSTNKWNCVFRKNELIGLTHSFRCYVVVGTLENVTTSMDQLYSYFEAEINADPIGNFDGIKTSYELHGWSLDPDEPLLNLEVQFYMDGPLGSGQLVGTTVADIPRPDVNVATGYPGDHGFGWFIPEEHRGSSHQFYVYGVDSEDSGSIVELTGSPKTYTPI